MTYQSVNRLAHTFTIASVVLGVAGALWIHPGLALLVVAYFSRDLGMFLFSSLEGFHAPKDPAEY